MKESAKGRFFENQRRLTKLYQCLLFYPVSTAFYPLSTDVSPSLKTESPMSLILIFERESVTNYKQQTTERSIFDIISTS